MVTKSERSLSTTSGAAFFSELAKGDQAPDWLSNAVIALWELPEGCEMTLLSVSENASFLVSLVEEPLAVLRVNRPGYLSGIAAVRSETGWVMAIARDTDVSVASPIPGRDGETAQSLPSLDGRPLSGVLSQHVSGDILENVSSPLPWFGRIGRDTAVLHEHARSWNPSPGFERFAWDTRWMLGPEARWGRWEDASLSSTELALLERARDRALGVVALAEPSPNTRGLIHADIRPSNVIIEGDQMTIIDFDDCGDGWFLYDFASAMTWLDHLPEAGQLAQAWIGGYREIRPDFSTADAQMACALDVIRSLTMLGWSTTHREEAVPRSVRGSLVDAVCHVSNESLRSPTWLFD